MTRRIDPEPITIYMAIVATYAAAVATANYVKTHYKALPTGIRAGLVASLAELEDHAKRLRTDVNIVKDIFSKATFSGGKTIRLGNGAQLTPSEFARYERTSDSILSRLRVVHRLCLKMERQAMKLPTLQTSQTTNVLGGAYTQLEALLKSTNLAIDSAWVKLDSIAKALEQAIEALRAQLAGE